MYKKSDRDFSSGSFKIHFCIWLGVLVLMSVIAILLWLAPIQRYETTDIGDYGKYTGNFNNETPRSFITTFFPEEIRDIFTHVVYSYRAEKLDTFAFEAYLEFTIEDPAEFHRYIDELGADKEWQPFAFDSGYMEHSVSNELVLGDPSKDEKAQQVYYIEEAMIGKILYSEKDNTIIYVAIGVYDGGGARTDYLSVFFERFGIDPQAYEKTADSPYVSKT